jgi:ABC-type multidrug transport system fused ATPase/permease subunit
MNNSIFKNFKKFHKILPIEFKAKFYFVILSVFIVSFLDLFSIIAVVPLISILTNPNILEENTFIEYLFSLLSFNNLNQFIVTISFALFLLFIIKNIISIRLLKFQAQFSYSLSKEISTKQYINYYNKGFQFISNHNSTVLVRDIFNMSQNFANGVTSSFITFLSEATIMTFIGLGLFIYRPVLMLGLLIILLPTFFIAYKIIKKKLKQIELDFVEITPKINQYLFNSFLGYIDVKLFGKEKFFFEKYTSLINRHSNLNVLKKVYLSITPKVFEIIIFLAVFLIVFYGLYILESPTTVVEILGIFALSAYKLIPSLNKIFAALVGIKSYEYIYEYFEPIKEISSNEIIHESSKGESLSFNKKIEIKNLSFSYDNKNKVLDQFCLSIKKGEYIGIIGKSGAGKTTLIKLLLRFLHETEGEITIDNKKLTPSLDRSWRKKIGYVPQQGYIVDGTLLDNIAFGVTSEEIDLEKVGKIVDLCSLEQLINESDKGIYQPIGEGGSKISGGQKQRIIIARALYREVEILILDEATSSLDNNTEQEVMETINKLRVNNISIISIAHRYSSLKNCDSIIELENGKIINTLKYDEL